MVITKTNDKSKSLAEQKPVLGHAPNYKNDAPRQNALWRTLAFRSAGIQPKLTVSQPGDPYEKEADRIAEQVMRTSESQISVPSGGGHTSRTNEQDDHEDLQTKAVQGSGHLESGWAGSASVGSASVETDAPAIVHEALHSPGEPVDPTTRGNMESRFGHDFSDVRVHRDARAADGASAIDARAYTVDRDIVFGQGEYAPQTESGRRLLSHELTHVVQQQSGIHPTVQRQPVPTPTATATPTAATALPTADELTTRIARCIGIWETNRGQNQPAPKESSLDTTAGVHASMATIEQATMPYAITALKRHKELRDKATPALTLKELNDAEARCVAVVTLLNSVSTASTNAQAPDDFIKDNTAAITASGLSDADVKTMFSAITLKATLATARTDIKTAEDAAKKEAADQRNPLRSKMQQVRQRARRQ